MKHKLFTRISLLRIELITLANREQNHRKAINSVYINEQSKKLRFFKTNKTKIPQKNLQTQLPPPIGLLKRDPGI